MDHPPLSDLLDDGSRTGKEDETEQGRVAEELRKSEDRFRMLADNISQLAWTCDLLGNVTWYNKRWLEYTGLKFEDMKGWGWSKVQHPDHVDRVVATVKRSGETGEPWEDTFPLRGKDGQYRWFLSRAMPIRDEHGNFIQWFGTNTDVTERVLAEEEVARQAQELRALNERLQELDRAKTAFFSNVSHEFRTPLTLMLGPLEELKSQFGRSTSSLDASQYQQVDVAHRNGLRLLKLVNQLLDFSRIEAERAQALYEETDLATFTAELASVFRSAIEKAGLDLIVDCPPLSEPVYVDRDMWEKIVLNLLSNAFKFTFDGEIEVALRHSGKHVELSIRDTGIGIPDDQLGKIFERFHRVAGSQGRTYEGTGIGLSLVQELARLHGGSVSVESRYGKGSTFRVFIPVGWSHLPHKHIGVTRIRTSTTLSMVQFVEEAARWLSDDNSAECSLLSAALSNVQIEGSGSEFNDQNSTLSSQQSRPRVLLADDNADMREYVNRLLKDRFEVVAVADGQAALEAVRKHQPDLVLSDVMMPRLDGFGLLRALRNDPSTKTIPVILLSARAGEGARVEGLGAGADDYLVKPFSARELLARVRSQLELMRLRRENEQRVSGILGSITDGFQTISTDYRFQYFNEAARRTFVEQGMNPDELIGRHIFDEVFPAERNQPWAAALRRTMTERISTEIEAFYAPWQRRFAARYYPAPDGGVSVFLQDITERKQAEQALRESEERYRTLFDSMDEGFCVIEFLDGPQGALSDYIHVEANPAYTANTGIPDIIGQKVRDMVPDEADGWVEIYRNVLVTGKPVRFERELVATGRHLELAAFRIEPPERRQVAVLFKDITDRKQSEEAKARLAAIVASSDDAIISKNLQGIITSWNKGAEKIFGYAAAEIIGRPIMMLIPPQRVDEEPKILASIRRGETVAHYETVRRRKDGTDIDISLTISPVRDETGNIIGASKIAHDISERKRADEALRRLNDELEQRVAERTRELAQSEDRLRALATELNLAEQRERKRLAVELHDHLQQTLVLGRLIAGQGKRMAATAPTYLDVMKKMDDIFSESLTYTRTVVADLSPPVLRDHGLPAALKWLGEYMKKHQIAVTVTVPKTDDLNLPEDQAVLLFQSARELLINSAKHSGTRQADVRLERYDGHLRIEVSDQGVGFDPVVAAASAGTPDDGGISSKFGLFSIHERMRALGGSFNIQSAPGEGTTATLTLPIGSRAEVRDVTNKERHVSRRRRIGDAAVFFPATPDSALKKNAKIRVLLVDDHPMMRQGLRSIVTAYDHLEVVGEAADGAEAVELAQCLDPDVVVMDINMPKMDGIEATQQIKVNQPTTVVIGLSVNQSVDAEQKMKAAGASTYLTKESAIDVLCHAIEQAVSCTQHIAARPGD